MIGGLGAAAALAVGGNARMRNLAIATGLATLLIAPAAWSVQTLGHATSGTFPAGGPANAGGGFGGGPGGGGRGGFRGGPPQGGGNFGGPPPGAAGRRAPARRPGAAGGTAPGAGGTARAARRPAPARRGTAPGAGGGAAPGASGGAASAVPAAGGGGFGGNSAALTEALAYIKANGGGTLAVSSQSTAAAAIIASNADIAGIGGFSGRESEVTVSWLAQEIRDGKIRWVLSDSAGGGGLRTDGRVGSTTAMDAVAASCKSTTVDGLYDCAGIALAAGS